MRSGTSFFDGTVFKKTITRFWPLWGAYLAIWLLLLPLNGLMLLRMDDYAGGHGYMQNFAMSRVPNAAGEDTALILALVFGALAAMAVFSHLYNARSANLFGSLPIRREGLFLTHYLAGLCFLIVPNAAIFLLTLLVEAAGGFVSIQALLFWLAVICGECFLFYSMAVFCAMFTGHILALPAFYAILNGIAAGIMVLIQVVFQAFYYGFTDFSEGVYTLVKWLTPVARLEEDVWGSSYWIGENGVNGGERVLELRGLGTVGIYALAALALTAGAFFLYRARRLESAGDVVSVRVMRPVFRYGVAVCAGLAFGIGTVVFTGGGEVTLMVAIVVWGVIGCFGAQMLLDKSFRVFKKWKGAAAVTAVFLALFCVVGFDLTGFETRIPHVPEVDSVNVSLGNAVYLGDDGDWLDMELTAPERINLITILHQEAVAQRDMERQTQNQIGGVSTSLRLNYTLKGGGTLSRWYTVWLNPDEVNEQGTAAWAMQQLYDDRELYWEVYGFDQLEGYLAQGYLLEQAAHERYDEETGLNAAGVFYSQDACALLAAVKEDFFAGRIGVRRLDDKEQQHYKTPDESLTFIAAQVNADGRIGVQIALQDTATSTWAALEEMADRAVVTGGYAGYLNDVIDVMPG